MKAHAKHHRVRYAQCWEDPDVLSAALDIGRNDDVVSIASGGDNSLALLLDNPRTLTIVDSNPAQIFLVELKIRAIENLDYDDFVSFVGARPCLGRKQIYARLRPFLNSASRGFWDERSRDIEQGIIHCGKFERYLTAVRRYALPLVHGKDTVAQLLAAATLGDQRNFFNHIWDNWRWRWIFRLLFGQFLLGRLGRDPSCYRYVTFDRVAEELLARMQRGLTEIPVRNNFFLEYIFTGEYRDLEAASPYLRKPNFRLLKQNVERIRLVAGTLENYLATLEPGTAVKFNLSDMFEYLPPPAVERTLSEILRLCRHGGRMAFWTLFVPQELPAALTNRIRAVVVDSATGFSCDRGFFYDNFVVWEFAAELAPGADAAIEGQSGLGQNHESVP